MRQELFRQEGDDFRTVVLSVDETGAAVETQDIGQSPKRWFGSDEYEFGVRVAPEHLGALVFALLKDRYTGRTNAADELRDYCRENSIPYQWSSWS